MTPLEGRGPFAVRVAMRANWDRAGRPGPAVAPDNAEVTPILLRKAQYLLARHHDAARDCVDFSLGERMRLEELSVAPIARDFEMSSGSL